VPPPASPVPLSLLQSSARTMFFGLIWGGVLLLILARWLGLRFGDERSLTLPWIIALFLVAGLLLAGWHAFVLWLQKTTPEQKCRALADLRRITAFALLGGGLAMLGIAVLLGFTPRPGGTGGWAALRSIFGEAVGLFLFALVTVGAGRTLLYPPRDELATVDLEPLRGLFPLIRTALFLVGIVSIGAFAIFAYQAYHSVGMTYFPELVGLLLFSMLCLWMGLWLMSNPAPDPFATRVFVLVFGGSAGLILFVMTLARAVVWRDQVFFSGMAIWQGEESWQLWLCVYLQLIALALMFGSLLLARADIRTNAVLRRVLFGYNTILNGLLVVQMLLVINIVLYAMVPYTFDWTGTRGLHALAQSSKNLLHQLKRPTHIYVLLSQGMSSQADVRTLLDNLQAETNKLDVTYVSPDRDLGQYSQLADLFPKILPSGKAVMRMNDESGRGLLIVYGDVPTKKEHEVPYGFIPERKIYDEPLGMPNQKPTKTFKGEVELMKEIKYLAGGGTRRKLYFLQGNDEIDIAQNQPFTRVDPRGEMSLLGASMLVDKLKKDNYDVEAITFSKAFAEDPKHKGDKVRYIGPSGKDQPAQIPDDAYALVIAGPSSPLPSEGLAAIEKYADKGGKLMVLLDMVVAKDLKAKELKLRETGLEDMLKKYGIVSTDEFAIGQMIPRTRIPIDPLKIPSRPAANSDNVIARQFAGSLLVFKSVRVIRPAPNPTGKYKAEPVFVSYPWSPMTARELPAVIAVRDLDALRDPLAPFQDLLDRKELERLVKEELPLVVAVSEDAKPRMVVFGDTEFISNVAMMQADRTEYSLFVSCLEWMAEHEQLIGPQPKETTVVMMPQNLAIQYTKIHLVPLWLMFLTIVGLGGGIWLVRRR
jgi:hypothetical protein